MNSSVPSAEERALSQVLEGNSHFAKGDLASAEASYRGALSASPSLARAHFNLALVLAGTQREDEALRHYAAAAEADPTSSKALVNWGNILKDRGELDAAAALYQRALGIDERDPHALNNLGSIFVERGELEAAEPLYRRALAIRPDLADARFNLALLQLRRREFESGWEGFELRFATRPPHAVLPQPDLPRANDVAAPGRLAIRMEQGVGDQLLFSTLLPELSRARRDFVVEVDPRLLAAFRRSLPEIEFVPCGASVLSQCDFAFPIGSLPRLFRRSVSQFASQPQALLRADAERVALVRSMFDAAPRIGIAWRTFQKGAGRKHVEDRKSAHLRAFGLLGNGGARLVDLQYGAVDDERRAFDSAHPGLREQAPGIDLFADLEGVLALIACCDLVVTTSNVTAHFAGALGKPTWLVYLGANAPFHYWVPDAKGRSLWYPSVEVLTDAAWSTWDEAFRQVAARVGDRGFSKPRPS